MILLSSTLRSIAFGVFVVNSARPSEARRRVLLPSDNIADQVGGGDHRRFTITAQVQGRNDAGNPFWSDNSAPSAPNTVSMDVVEAQPAITADTYILSEDGTRTRFGDSSNSLATILVSDVTTPAGRSGLTILAVDPITREMQGVTEQRGGNSMKIRQGSNGGVVSAVEEEEMVRPAWKCGVAKRETLFNRALRGGHDHDSHEHDHNHHDDHEHDHHHDAFDPNISAIENLSRSIRGTKVNPLNKRRLQNTNAAYNYQVDLFLEIDNAFVNEAPTGGGGTTKDANGITPNAYNYINTLIAAANVLYESEIDTHLHVHTIKLSTLYDSAGNTDNALNIMRSTYKGNSWHTVGVDVHHAMLGTSLGGGKAYMGVLCDPDYGFGVTGSMSGGFASLDQRAVWDSVAFMHEVGHQFNSGHTHDPDDYSPVIDTCDPVANCPATAGNQWSTIMSYCDQCTGGWSNIMYTFGGIYDGSGSKSDIGNWINKPELVANFDSTHRSIDARRVSHVMYSHVSTRGSCVIPPPSGPTGKPTPNPTNIPTVKPTPSPTNIPTVKPTNQPTSKVTFATYDSTLKVPKCAVAVESCSSGNLLDGIGNLGPAEQGNAPNTLGTCTDGTSGTYHSDESVDAIKVSSTDGGLLTAGKTAQIDATVYAYSTTSDFVDFYYTTNPSNPIWTKIGTVSPPGTGVQTIKMQYTLPSGTLHAVRVVIRYKESASTSNPFQCPSSGYDDIDDIVFTVSGSGTPVTPNPTFAPTNKPTEKPTLNPTKKPALSPTKKPASSSSPTKKPTQSPTKKPSAPPTKKPTSTPTQKPTAQPTDSPTKQPVTPGPSKKPTTAPTSKPANQSTSLPTSAGNGPQTASFDSTYGAPRCSLPGSACSSGTLVAGRGNLNPGTEPNYSNTIDGCVDGAQGTYREDESIEKVVVRSGEIDGSGSGTEMVVGGRATIIASVFAWSAGAYDTADFFYSSTASSPNWQYIGSIKPSGGQEQDLKIAYTLPTGSDQAVRVQFRYQGSNSGACTTGGYNDRDDLVFAVKSGPTQTTSSPTKAPTRSPVKTPPPSQPAGSGPQQASYDSALTVPRCSQYGSECNSLNLLNGRGTLSGGNEQNAPNTLDSCVDGNYGTYHDDESVDKIVVRSGDINGLGSGLTMVEGGTATIIATVYSWSAMTDYADFYYASDALNPTWQFIGTKVPDDDGVQDIKISYTLPAGEYQAVRVNFRYEGSLATTGACSNGAEGGSYDDSDDLVFRVKSNPSLTRQ